MRDPERIDKLCAELAKIWKENYPDWRFMQLICNFQRWWNSDGFFYEDDVIIEKFCQFMDGVKVWK